MTTSLGSPTLVLVPTPLELRRLADLGGFGTGWAMVETCGFGPVAAAARTASLLAELRPAGVLLVGIAGAYDTDVDPIGIALEFGAVAVDGIGVGEGRTLLAPPALGFPQWPGSAREALNPIFDSLPLTAPPGADALLVTTCAASANKAQAAVRRKRFPKARAEDMEGFAVATACALARVPVRIVRGVSNRVGDREPEHWNIPLALSAARRLALEVLAGARPWGEHE